MVSCWVTTACRNLPAHCPGRVPSHAAKRLTHCPLFPPQGAKVEGKAPSAEDGSGGRTFREVILRDPIRYASGDEVEKWLNGLLCLDAAEHIPKPPGDGGKAVPGDGPAGLGGGCVVHPSNLLLCAAPLLFPPFALHACIPFQHHPG